MDKIIKNYQEPVEKPLSARESFKYIKHKRSVKKINRLKKKIFKIQGIVENIDNTPSQPSINTPPNNEKVYYFAILVDDVVVDIMHVQEGFSNLLKSNPKFIFIENEKELPRQGWIYLNEKFVPFDQIIREAQPTVRG